MYLAEKIIRCDRIGSDQLRRSQIGPNGLGAPCWQVSEEDWRIIADRMRRIYDYGDNVESEQHGRAIFLGRLYLRSLNA